MKKIILAATTLSILTACGGGYTPQEVANHASAIGSCPEVETLMHDMIQENYEKTGAIPSADDVVSEFSQIVKPMSTEQNIKDQLITSFKDLYLQLENQITNREGSKEDKLKALGQLEFGTHPDQKLQKTYSESLKSFKSLSVKTFSSCNKDSLGNENLTQPPIVAEPTPADPVEDPIDTTPALPFFEELKLKTANLSQYGALKSFAIAYQSCESISIDALQRSSQNTEGISVVGKHPSGRGNKREITNLSKTQRTHPYIKNFRRPASTCVDSTKKPLIYDFGGKPYATSSSSSTLNFFRNAGSGSKELGVDCSGYVFSALMSAGLKLSPDKPLRARSVSSIPARAYKKPGAAMSCIKKVKAGTDTNLQPGDIFASNGHIFIVNLVGQDPLGVEKALKNDSCSSITYKDFNFTLLQSSPSKGAVGMNHMDGNSYLRTSSTMRRGLEKFAQLDCKNKMKNKVSTPSIDEASLVRHLMTPDCISDRVIKLDNQSCVERCSYDG